jgi:hypothetical protein
MCATREDRQRDGQQNPDDNQESSDSCARQAQIGEQTRPAKTKCEHAPQIGRNAAGKRDNEKEYVRHPGSLSIFHPRYDNHRKTDEAEDDNGSGQRNAPDQKDHRQRHDIGWLAALVDREAEAETAKGHDGKRNGQNIDNAVATMKRPRLCHGLDPQLLRPLNLQEPSRSAASESDLHGGG